MKKLTKQRFILLCSIASFCKLLLFLTALFAASNLAYAATNLADRPLSTGVSVPGNVALALSVEFPTALGSAYLDSYNPSRTKSVDGKDVADPYVGYFDSEKCYQYASASGPILFNTGVDNTAALLADGSTDSHWISPSGGLVDDVYQNSYLLKNATSQSLGVGNFAIGSYTYQTVFNIPVGKDPSSVTVTFNLSYDDQLTGIKVNGVNTGISNSSLSQSGISIKLDKSNSNFVVGNNTISIVIYNTGSGSGIRVDQIRGLYDADGSYFVPVKATQGQHDCTGFWSGNLLNWALTQTIDPLRLALTGGYRSVDKASSSGNPSLTVLEKAWASGQGGTVVNPTITGNKPLITKSTPYNNLDNLIIAIAGLGNKLTFTGNSASTTVIPDYKIPTTIQLNVKYEMFARVKVCDAVVGLESNCKSYGSNNYKPEGLIQQNALKLNFAAFGYLNDSNIKRDGGVLRAKMAPLGPLKPVINGSPATNANPEWDATTGVFITNPDPVDAAVNSVSNSGVINYLNKFGLTGPGYKTYDPVSELYYSVIRYYKNLGNVPAYTNGATAAMADGFPVITDWNDPIQSGCQANFIIGVGDSNSHADSNLPGSTIASSNEPAMPTEVANDATVNVKTATNKVGALEGYAALANLGQRYTPWCCSNNSFFIAGLAYDSHTKDMRTDFTGVQTVSTYWLDVLESGDRKNVGGTGFWNQFWFAAKYGGFTVTDPEMYSTYGATKGPDLGYWDSNNDGDPDNYFRANNPKVMIDGLTNAFKDILSKSDFESNGFVVANNDIQNGSMSFSTTYRVGSWQGDLIGTTVTNNSGTASFQEKWKASVELDKQVLDGGWSTKRKIVTSVCVTDTNNATQTCQAKKFTPSEIPTLLDNFGATLTDQTNAINFLRGSNSANTGLRQRPTVLGDIINSRLLAYAVPNERYTDAFNPGYSDFKKQYENRLTVAYVGANDGMLHAFNGSPDGGNELFAYVPNAVIAGPTGTPMINGIAALTKPDYSHNYYVDASPFIRDVYFSDKRWHSVLVSGLGKGGKAYFALDVTDPAAVTNEEILKSKVLWEFKHPLMGYSYGEPIIVKTKRWGWTVILTSGYNNTNGKGYFFLINPETGLLYQPPIPTNEGGASNDAGLAHAEGFVPDSRDFTADAVYAGDLLGNLWRLDLTGSGDVPAPTKIAILKSAQNDPQPVTIAPAVAADPVTQNRRVLVGTGSLLADTDLASTQIQTFYSILDGTSTQFFTTSTLPNADGKPIKFPISRENLVDGTNQFASGITADLKKPMGYYVDLGKSSKGSTFRANVPLTTNDGAVYVAANSISPSVCSPVGENIQFVLDISSGASRLLNSSGVKVASVAGTGIVNSIFFYRFSGTEKINAGSSGTESYGQGGAGNSGSGSGAPGNSGPYTVVPSVDPLGAGFKLLNWRELPTPD